MTPTNEVAHLTLGSKRLRTSGA